MSKTEREREKAAGLTEEMKFGKDFKNHLEETLPEWRDKFLCYKPLKKLIKHLPADDNHHGDNKQNQDDDDDRPRPGVIGAGLEDWFVRILNEELEKFNDFYVDKEEEFVIRLQVCMHLPLFFC